MLKEEGKDTQEFILQNYPAISISCHSTFSEPMEKYLKQQEVLLKIIFSQKLDVLIHKASHQEKVKRLKKAFAKNFRHIIYSADYVNRLKYSDKLWKNSLNKKAFV